MLKKQMEESGNYVEDKVDDNEMVPDLKYQVNVITRDDDVYTAGKWTEKELKNTTNFLLL